MIQQRLNSIMLLHIHKEDIEDIYLMDSAKAFARANQKRGTFFGGYTCIGSVLPNSYSDEANMWIWKIMFDRFQL